MTSPGFAAASAAVSDAASVTDTLRAFMGCAAGTGRVVPMTVVVVSPPSGSWAVIRPWLSDSGRHTRRVEPEHVRDPLRAHRARSQDPRAFPGEVDDRRRGLLSGRTRVEVNLDDNTERTLAETDTVTLKPGHGFSKKIKFQRG